MPEKEEDKYIYFQSKHNRSIEYLSINNMAIWAYSEEIIVYSIL
jgi:hypothetical protein